MTTDCDGGVHIDIPEGVKGQGGRVWGSDPTDGVVHEDIAVGAYGAVAVGRCIGASGGLNGDTVDYQSCRKGRSRYIATRCRHGEVHWIDQPTAGNALCCKGGDVSASLHVDDRRRGFDEASIATLRGTRIQRTSYRHASIFQSAQQLDRSFRVNQRLRLNQARVVDRIGQQAACYLRCHQNLTTVRLDQPAVLDQCIQDCPIHTDIQEPIARHVKRYCGATS